MVFVTVVGGAKNNSVVIGSLSQKTVFEDDARIALRLPLGDVAGALHPGGCFPLSVDPRDAEAACIVGMMVLRPATARWAGPPREETLAAALIAVDSWCYDVVGVGGSWPVSGGNAVDAYRLALQYGTVDAVLAGATTMAREGVVAGARRAHLWQPYTPLGWAPLAPHREVLEPAIAQLRRTWQSLGVLSPRTHPAQIAVTASGRVSASGADLLDARVFHDHHPDGSPIEGYVLTSEAGAERIRARAAVKGLRADTVLIVVSPPGAPETIDIARVPQVLRQRLDARLVEHDGGALSLTAFAEAGAVAQLNLTLMKGRSVRDVISGSARLTEADREALLASWPSPARLFRWKPQWGPMYAIAAEDGEALVVSLASARGSTPNRFG